MSYNYLAWDPDVEITPVFMKKPASGTSPISGGALLKAGTPLNNSKAVANTENAKYIVAEDYIFYNDPGQNRDPVKLISAGYVDLAKAQTAWGKVYTDAAIAALGEAGITLVDGATLPEVDPLPAVTSDDNGDVLTVVSGEWAKAAPSGGGVLVCTTNMQTMALDKTWQEIHDSVFAVIVIQISEDDISRVVVAETVANNGQFVVNGYMGNTLYAWIATSADGYPVLNQG